MHCFTSRLAWRGHTSKMGWFESLNPLTPGCRLITAETHDMKTFFNHPALQLPCLTTRRKQCANHVYACVTLVWSYCYEFPKTRSFDQKVSVPLVIWNLVSKLWPHQPRRLKQTHKGKKTMQRWHISSFSHKVSLANTVFDTHAGLTLCVCFSCTYAPAKPPAPEFIYWEQHREKNIY